ncbi:MAG: polysaccharide pyruvyl transferase family protein [Oscillospiraceae bacterium]|nr:polysaccharide pyruvyl transferase family protein [Oscillospiraceae bacterium]
MIDIKILLFGTFEGERASIERFFAKAELTEYDTPLSLFVTTRFKTLAGDADIALMGGEPRYKSYILAAKKAGCKTVLWGCEFNWLTTSLTALQQFDLIFARDKETVQALKAAGFSEVSLCPSAPPSDTPRPAAEAVPTPEAFGEPEPSEPPIQPEPVSLPEPAGPPEPAPAGEQDFTLIVDIPPSDLRQTEDAGPASRPEPPPKTPFDLPPVTTVYGAANLNENIRSVSSAGGVFSLLCEDTIRRGGVVFGSRYTDTFEVLHAMADRIPDCVPMRGAKFVESKTGNTFEQAAACLRRGTPVLFSGTACQIAELNAYLCWLPATALSMPDEYSSDQKTLADSPLLLTVDVVCSGVAEPAVFSAYLQSVEKKLGASATAADLSGKPRGWHKATVRIGSEGGTYESPAYRDPFIRAYRAGLCLAEKCYDCPYRVSDNRGSDLTLGAFEEGRKHIPELYDDKGASLVLAHTDRGRAAIEAIGLQRAVFCEIPPDALAQYNPALSAPLPRHEKREQFLADCRHLPFAKAVSRALGPVIVCILLHKRTILPPSWRKVIRNKR